MRWKIYAGILVVFLLGTAAGAMIGVQYERAARERINAERAQKSAVDFFSRRMGHEVGLSEAQMEEVRGILAAVQPEIYKLEEARREGVQKIMDETHPKILAVLDEAQKEKFVEMQNRVRRHLERKYKWRASGHEPGRGGNDPDRRGGPRPDRFPGPGPGGPGPGPEPGPGADLPPPPPPSPGEPTPPE